MELSDYGSVASLVGLVASSFAAYKAHAAERAVAQMMIKSVRTVDIVPILQKALEQIERLIEFHHMGEWQEYDLRLSQLKLELAKIGGRLTVIEEEENRLRRFYQPKSRENSAKIQAAVTALDNQNFEVASGNLQLVIQWIDLKRW